MAERTKLWIAQVMKQLMAKKEIENIRVTEICKLARIERPTFYYHFKDKYDLVAWIFFYSAFETDVISLESAAQSINRMRADFLFYKRAYRDVSQNSLWNYMLEYFVDRYTKEAKRILETDVLDTQVLYSIRFYCYGGVGMTKEWLLTDNITSAETVVNMMFASMPACLRAIFFDD
ncbi:TetR/AcrR family transcriptional regulator C-terminal domain-containing protein [Collinsella sp. zg1085]|uniref:TetR/AcrR family transcriptional regulator C-terminal domain-containing protein n=1 Tax=Collinsella sp. zg1085 TaxID=2844380 RepID=UPI001C0CFBCB|nr:TetR/AcrR family transcriptional regulator C-terminal domain-containing protein [Collinsella sp. zg1085]QWT17974.1 TetR/AcrR family transcriptional regulator C-terminal domain-containing protein [Collinsella sp. zg1085]